jgi:predicted transcriptional regulator
MSNVYLDSWRMTWQRAGLPDPHPLRAPGGGNRGKEYVEGCEGLPPADQWRKAYSKGSFWNMGLLPGSTFAIIDCDDGPADTNMRAGLAGLGLRSVAERTPSGGAHLWLRVRGVPEGANDFIPLRPDIGRGHILRGRYNVAVTCSVGSNGKTYHFDDGAEPATIAALPVVSFRDLTFCLPVAVSQGQGQAPALDVQPLRLLHRDAPSTEAMLLDLRGWPEATTYLGYKSASEAEAAAVARLILAGWGYDAIRAAFDKYSPGSFIRNLRGRYKYLRHTYQNILGQLAATPPRPAIADAWQTVQSTGMAWPGRGGLYDQAVLSGLLALAWASWPCEWQVGASVRDLGQYASCSHQAVSNALGRLVDAGLIRRAGYENGTGRYDLSALASNIAIRHGGATYSESEKGVEEVGVKSAGAGGAPVDLPGGSELWSVGLLGLSAGAVYQLLSDDPAGACDLAELSGKGRRTIERALNRLASCGLAERLVAGWVRGPADAAAVASVQGAPLAARLRHEHHERERLAWDDTKARAGKGTSVG